ncbi:tetratricopeptide repeat protein [Humisphaera borealis]|uniref:Tetratricopeptide repeat protein n=1 Tax=Humisphaera borealis TaxID=2807512 RepID=A0A7M2WSQ6_9BACT|nr:hypothetical protein [Humisphaera borealis]QOV88496.1 hypothetical protein IPV69_19930 [Humisphaera borealis]
MQNSKPNKRIPMRWVLAAAIAGPVMGLMGLPAPAQYRVNQDGSARDANNRVGSSGRNDGGPIAGSGVTPDMIIYGNVTNSKYFRGPTAAPDARAFRGNTGSGVSDSFIRDSSGGYDKTSVTQRFTPTAYYGDARAVAAPAGFVPTKSTTVYNTNQPALAYSSAANLGSLSTGEGLVPKLGSAITALPTPNTGAQAPNSAIVMSPLGGIRQLGFGEEPLNNDIYTIRNGSIVPSGASTDRFRTDRQMLEKMQDELTAPGQGVEKKTPSGLEGTQPLGQPLEGPASSQLKSPALKGSTLDSNTLQSGVNSEMGLRRQLATPAQQSQQMNELERRLRERQGDRPMTGQEIQRDLNNAAAAAKKPAAKPGTPGAPTPGAPGTPTPGSPTPGTPAPAVTPAIPMPATPKADPLMIKSLAAGVSAKSLADVLTKAEVLMKDGKFAEALDQYDLAERAAPNNALITLGRANAELGASSYRSAETHLRQALGGEPALLLGKYDLQGMIGTDRLAILTKDLRDLAANEPRESMASFLLAYIAYNTGSDAEAAGHLNEVTKRSGAADPVVAKMRELWSLPGGGLNK